MATLEDVWLTTSILCLVLGVFGVFLPFLPSTPLLLLAALIYDFGHGFAFFGLLWLTVLGLLTAVGVTAEWWLSNVTARRAGASWQALAVGAVAGIVGLLVLSLPGLLLGSVAGVVGTEVLRMRDVRRALRAGGGWFVGWVLALLVEGSIVAIMLGIYVWRVFL